MNMARYNFKKKNAIVFHWSKCNQNKNSDAHLARLALARSVRESQRLAGEQNWTKAEEIAERMQQMSYIPDETDTDSRGTLSDQKKRIGRDKDQIKEIYLIHRHRRKKYII